MLNVKNRTIYCRDNIDILRGINSNCIDLIYLDPPFNKKKVFTAPIGSSAEGAEFSDIFREEDIKDEWVKEIEADNYELHSLLKGIKDFSNQYNYCYCVYMAIRLIEIGRILKNTGSVYLHCDPTMSHYLKLVMDCIFGEKNFRNEVIWCYRGAGYPKKDFGNRHDIIFRYSKTNEYVFNVDEVREEYAEATKERFKHYIGNVRKGKDFGEQKLHEKGRHPDDWWQIQPIAPSAKERTGYPTQKPLALLEKIIKASSKEGDMVLDPFCGCATTCIAAEKLERNWVGIDVSQKAYELVKERLKKEVPVDFFRGEPNFQTALPKRTDSGDSVSLEQGYIYIISNKAFRKQLKIGIAKNPQARLNSYQTSDPNRGYKLEKFYQTKFNADIEKRIHQHYQAPNEWIATSDIDEVFDLIKKFDDELKNN
ncbi:MAG: DNA methyltransferase [Hydrotalea sp.]|nr:DNA methyltransferase [Hydrotalea sp.]